MARDLGIDIGTSTTTIYVKGKGIVLSEPSVVAINTNTGKPIAVGTGAERMMGRTPESIVTVKPVRGGAIADFESAELMLKYFITKVCGIGRNIGSIKMLLSIPSKISEVEQLAVLEAAKRACGNNARVKPKLIEEPLAAAIGADLPLTAESAEGSMVVDIGGGTTEIAVFSMGCILKSDSIKVGGEDFDTAVINYMKSEYNILVGEKTAENVKIKVGCVYPTQGIKSMEVCGRRVLDGLPAGVRITSDELIRCFKDSAVKIVECVKSVLDGLPPEISSDIAINGITMTGGGSLLSGLAEFLRTETGVPVKIADSAQYCVALGNGRCISDNSIRAIINANRSHVES